MKTNAQLALEAGIHALTQLRLIEILAAEGEIGMTVAAERIDVTSAAITGSVDALEKRGFIRRDRPDQDRRRINLELTSKGIEFAATLSLPEAQAALA